ncbi:hypothetical protein JYU34_014354 [Plutella xylostella]|uniref:Uncharacterized protein n=1 Tax=Plutella xylostella TaxID=51655 RepID=A0ABQ7Q852_PLUXY|nr:hypothetical protein JYU34_014354 [Plutella xylostella]
MPATNPDGYEFSRSHKKAVCFWSGSFVEQNAIKEKWYPLQRSGQQPELRLLVAVEPGVPQPLQPGALLRPSAFSEPDTRAVRDVLLNNAGRIKLA